ncbi:GYD domain-containing protein [Crenobacter sp. SG2303]|uniref:GYD domain-containing protein n=1 Tax=Crenobacter oryzisoli TaxID=3056844 RepID=A0ABT7XU14_9NEIS|nr:MULTISPECIES: GYD domain-containing protein [unclassified Crenobacter]MDN0077225.1 GYD domain-containing protein [Crenobacter sp. SG2303]MDN0084730.1 GYD domain-containing protein [Crenobacter sp. SG2305]
MATYIVLINFTDQGIRAVKDTTKRAAAFREMATKAGVTVKDMYWTLGLYDLVVTLDAPDTATITAVGLTLGAAGNVRTQTLPAFSATEMDGILTKMM